MKHLLTAIACCLAVAGSAQTPYNPDSDGDTTHLAVETGRGHVHSRLAENRTTTERYFSDYWL